jgi:hypothetical protein
MTDKSPPLPIKDVVDFYARWPELRPRVVAIAQNGTISESDVEILNWLIAVVDMIGPSDLQT